MHIKSCSQGFIAHSCTHSCAFCRQHCRVLRCHLYLDIHSASAVNTSFQAHGTEVADFSIQLCSKYCAFCVVAAEANQRDQGLPAHSQAERCEISEDQEDRRCDEIQGPMQPLPVHALRDGLRQGRQAQAVPAPRSATTPFSPLLSARGVRLCSCCFSAVQFSVSSTSSRRMVLHCYIRSIWGGHVSSGHCRPSSSCEEEQR